MSDDILVIMPCYNTAVTITEAIKSVYSQTYKHFKLVCIDDCSTDTTLVILNKLKAIFKFDLLTNTHNQGTGSTINNAIACYDLSKFKYITWVSADNILSADFLLKLVTQITQSKADICYGAWNSFYHIEPSSRFSRIKIRSPKLAKVNNPNPNLSHLKQTFSLGPAFLYTTQLWNTIGPYHKLPGEDYLFAVKASLQKAKFCFVMNTPLVSYRIHDNSVSGRQRNGIITDIISPYAMELAQQIEDNI